MGQEWASVGPRSSVSSSVPASLHVWLKLLCDTSLSKNVHWFLELQSLVRVVREPQGGSCTGGPAGAFGIIGAEPVGSQQFGCLSEPCEGRSLVFQIASKYDHQAEEDLRNWIEEVTGMSIGTSFQLGLKDGIILCE